MNLDLPPEIELASKDWPTQVLTNHEQWWKTWITTERPTAKQRSIDKLEFYGKMWAAFANGKSLTPRTILEFGVRALNKVSVKTKKVSLHHARVMTEVSSYLKWLKRMGIITHDPSFAMPKYRRPPPPPIKMFTHEEFLKILKWCSPRQNFQMHLWLIILSYSTGMSLADCCLLEWGQVILSDDGPCYIERIREKMSRVGAKALFRVPIIPGSLVWVWFKKLHAARDLNYKSVGHDYVHPDAAGWCNDANYTALSEKFMTIFNLSLGGSDRKDGRFRDGRTFKNLRNSFCSRLVNSGADSVLVSKMTGHQNLTQLSDYVRPDLRAMTDALVKGWRWAEGETSPPGNLLPSPITDKPNEMT